MRNRRLRGAARLLTPFLLAAALAAPVPAESTGGEIALTSEAAAAETAPEAAYADPSVIPSNGIEGWPLLADTNSDYFCVMDADTGCILAEKGMDTETPPASLTKILTTLLAIERGNLDDVVTMTKTGVEYAISGSSNLYTQVGEEFVLRDMLYGVMLKSANDMATQVGEYIGGGSLDSFLSMMNERAAGLGCAHSYFANSCGMPNDAHHSSAHDLALISQEALKNPTFREIVHTKEYTIPATNLTEARTFQNHHKFLVSADYVYDGIIGGKTGYTDLAGSCLATYVERDGRTVIVIAMHCLGMDNCLADTRRLCDYGLDSFENVTARCADGSDALITVPRGQTAEACTVSEEEEVLEGGAVRTTYAYSFSGHPVGTAVSVREAEAEDEEEAEDTAISDPAEDPVSGGTEAQAEAGDRADTALFTLPLLGEISLVGLFGLILGVLIIVILLLLIVNIHLQRARKRARQRRRREDRGRGSSSGRRN